MPVLSGGLNERGGETAATTRAAIESALVPVEFEQATTTVTVTTIIMNTPGDGGNVCWRIAGWYDCWSEPGCTYGWHGQRCRETAQREALVDDGPSLLIRLQAEPRRPSIAMPWTCPW